MLRNLNDLLSEARRDKIAIGAFNATTLESTRAIIQAAEELNVPVILQHAQSHDHMISLDEMGPILLHYAKRASVPVAVHLDHGCTFERCIQAIRIGFTSIMYDASNKKFEQNIRETQEIVKIAHSVGVSVEAELGHVFTSDIVVGKGTISDSAEDYQDLNEIYTDPKKAQIFVKETQVDCLAVAFGTTHGMYLKKPKLDLNRIKLISKAVNIPLVMHGGSGVSEDDYKIAINNGICKINYYTYMNKVGADAASKLINDNNKMILFYDQLSLYATEKMKEDIKKAISIFSF